MPRRRQSRSRSAHDWCDSRNPSVSATSSLRPSARTPIITSRHSFSCSNRIFRRIPSAHRQTSSTLQISLCGEGAGLVLPLVVSRVIDDADRPAPVPRNCMERRSQSPEDRPCRYSSGRTSVICVERPPHAGRIAEENRCRSPVSGSVSLVVHPRRFHLHRTRAGSPPVGGWWVAIADHESTTVLVDLVGERSR